MLVTLCAQHEVRWKKENSPGQARREGGRGGGGGAESARADFNLRELPCCLSNSYDILPLLLKSIGEQDSVTVL